jgi:hypothetical protein
MPSVRHSTAIEQRTADRKWYVVVFQTLYNNDLTVREQHQFDSESFDTEDQAAVHAELVGDQLREATGHEIGAKIGNRKQRREAARAAAQHRTG